MPFLRRTLSELRQDAASDINGELPGADALLRFSNLGIIGRVLAGFANLFYGYLDWIARQSVPFTATDEFLEAWAARARITRKPATLAHGSATFTGTDGSVIASGTTVARGDGFTYATTEEGTIASGTVTVPISAAVAGALGNAPDGVALTLGIGISGVDSSGTAAGAITGGADVEPDEELRSRMNDAYAQPAQGGSRSDYIRWAREVPGVTRCWPIGSGMGPGTVVLLFMMDDANAAFGGFPQGTSGVATEETRDTPATGDQLTLANAIYEQQGLIAVVYAVAPSANTIDLTIAGISSASTETKAAIAAAFAAALRFSAQPGGITNVSALEAAIASVAGTAGFVITAITASAGTVSPGSAGNITSNAAALPVPGTITYVP